MIDTRNYDKRQVSLLYANWVSGSFWSVSQSVSFVALPFCIHHSIPACLRHVQFGDSKVRIGTGIPIFEELITCDMWFQLYYNEPSLLMISVLGSFTCITQHTGPAALRPIQRTKQLRLSVLLKDTSAATGNRTHILVFWQHQILSPVHQTARPRHSDTVWLLVCSSCLCIMYIAGLAFHCKAMPSVSLVPIEKYSHRHSDILMEMPCTDSEAKWHCPYKKGIAGLYMYIIWC